MPESRYIEPQANGTQRNLDAYEIAITWLNAHFAPKLNLYYKRQVIINLKPEENETIDRRQAKDRDKEIVVQIIEGSNQLRLKLLEKSRSLDEEVQFCKSFEKLKLRFCSSSHVVNFNGSI